MEKKITPGEEGLRERGRELLSPSSSARGMILNT
jgi:hypothetical protein